VPNPPADDVPSGGEEDFEVLCEMGTKPSFAFTARDHLDLAEPHGWLDAPPQMEHVFACVMTSVTRAGSGKRVSNRKALAQIDLHWHDLRHEALSRLADDGVPVHELQLLAGHSSITTTQRYMNARASSLAESMRQARERRVNRVEHADEATAQIG
jgi:site-specific recombinase XerD